MSASEQAVNLVKKAVQFYKENGAEKAFAEFNKPAGQFVEGDLYIFVYDLNGVNAVHGANPSLIGKNLIDMQDPDGKFIIKELIQIATTKGSGWFDYKYKNPKSGSIDWKSSYVEKLDNYFIGCGIYKTA